jgi:hypothetical protein
MENHHFLWVNQLYMAIFNSYVSLPEGIHLPPILMRTRGDSKAKAPDRIFEDV